MSAQGWWWAAGAALAAAAVSGLAEWRRARRRDLDDAGWVPWRGIQAASLFAAAAAAILAMRG